jgi:exo-1,4-beta-D-glucosaminidase
MSRVHFCLAVTIAFAALLISTSEAQAAAAPGSAGERVELNKDWQLQSSCEVKATGEQVSAVGFDGSKWHRADLPNTVVGALVDDKTYADPTVGTNLKSLPGMDYSSKTFFALQDMPKDSPFRCSWWFRTEFSVPAEFEKKTQWLHMLGINYRANVWINGKKLADEKDVAGTFVTFEFEVGKFLVAGKTNALAVEIFAPQKNDLGITWVDWNPTPADKDMGIWKDVFLTASDRVSVRNAFVASKLDTEYKTAALTLSAELRNSSAEAVEGTLRVVIDAVQVRQTVNLAAGESKIVEFSPEHYAELNFVHPRLWWPYQMGEPNLYTAKFRFELDGRAADASEVTFGIREATSELTDRGYRLFKINGRKVLIRGAAWAPDMFLRWSPERVDADLAYVRDMGLNTIRLEGRIDHEEFFAKADKLGLLVMPGWTCCDAWERWKNWKPEQHKIAGDSLRSQIRILRNHPSVFVWLYGSDNPPPADVENMYLGILKELDWPNPSVSSAADTATTVTGKSGVKMTGPYEYVPPVYWLTDTTAGGAYGYNTETSPGPAIPPRESIERFIPKDHLWPIDAVWNYHAGGERFTTVNVFNDGLTRRYGPPASLDDYERKAQAMTYDGQRAMFEAYGRNKYVATGVIQWMLNNAWPSLIWHLYDYYMVPAGGYYGTKKATEPVHVQYSYDDNSVAVVNGTYQALKGVKVSAKLYNIDAKEKGAKAETLDVASDSSAKAFEVPKVADLSTTYFLRLDLRDATGKLLSDNFYWLSTKADTLDWKHKKDTVYTPQAEFGDLTGLNSLPAAKLIVDKQSLGKNGHNNWMTLTIENKGEGVAFMVHPRLTQGKGGQDVTPIFWDDNYFSLLPGEKRSLRAHYDDAALAGTEPVLEVEGYNVVPGSVPVGAFTTTANEN